MLSKIFSRSTLAVLFLAAPVLAQPLWIGVRGGANFPSSTLGTALRQEGTAEPTGFAGGLSVFQRLGDSAFALRTEVLIVTRTTRLRFPDPINDFPPIDADYKTVNLELPINAMLVFGKEGSSIRPYVFLGPNFQVRLSAKSENVSGSRSGEFDVTDQVSASGVSIEAGGGALFTLSPKMGISIDVRYSHGLTDWAKFDDDEWKTRDIRALVGVEFLF